jgi:hypothetical protein
MGTSRGVVECGTSGASDGQSAVLIEIDKVAEERHAWHNLTGRPFSYCENDSAKASQVGKKRGLLLPGHIRIGSMLHSTMADDTGANASVAAGPTIVGRTASNL